MVTAQAFDTPLLDIHMTGNKELTKVEKHEAIESQREKETSDMQAGIPEDLQESIHMYDKLIAGQVSADAVCLENVLDRLNGKLEEQKGAMACHPTACLWMQYMDMISLLCQFIKTEWTRQSLQEMLPYFVAEGHNLYAKSVHINFISCKCFNFRHNFRHSIRCLCFLQHWAPCYSR